MIAKRILSTLGAILLLTLVSAPASAFKPIKFGLRGGVQTSSLNNIKHVTLSDMSARGNVGFQLAAMSRISLLGLYVQPELSYSFNNFKMEGANNTSSKFSVQNFEVPILFGYKFFLINLFAGPSFNLTNQTGVEKGKNPIAGFNTEVTKSTVGFQAGVGVEISHFYADLRYCGGFKKPHQLIGNEVFKTSMNTFQLNLGYFF